MMCYRRCFLGVFVGCFVLLAGCASQKVSTRSIPIEVIASQTVNPDTEERPSPVAFVIYQLAEKEPFMAADFDTLFDPEKTQASAVAATILKRKQYRIQPGKRAVMDLKVLPETRFIAVVAAFRVLDSQGTPTWSSIAEWDSKMVKKAKRYQAKVALNGNQVDMYLVKRGKLSIF